ncbi:MAG: class I SAM-dependent methyltransferase [Magnetococcales bacterium]|nr:class I SAM-dependent methyltransferase [Magnetococcales bacterium]
MNHSIHEKLMALIALNIIPPFSDLFLTIRTMSRRIRGKSHKIIPCTIKKSTHRALIPNQSCGLIELGKADGNVRLSELAILSLAAAATEAGTQIIEIGTFDGRTSLNLANNAPPGCTIHTLDLPIGDQESFQKVTGGDQKYLPTVQSGARIDSAPPHLKQRITRLYGDSTTFDWSPYHGQAGLVFVDGAHTYEFTRKDTETAFKLARNGALIIWHDYGVWKGVNQALEEICARDNLDMIWIRGTSLVLLRVKS